MSRNRKPKKELEFYIKQAKRYSRKKMFGAAVDELLEASSYYPHEYQLYTMMGKYARNSASKELNKAIKRLEKTITYKTIQEPIHKKSLFKILNELAILHQKKHSPEDLRPSKEGEKKQESSLDMAINYLEQAIDTYPNEASYMILSYTYQLKGNLTGALSILQEGLDLLGKSEKIKERKDYLIDQNKIGEFIEEVRGAIAKGDLDNAFTLIKDKTKEKFDEIYEAIINQQRSLRRLREQHTDGEITDDQYAARETKIVKSIMRMINRLY